MHGSLVVFLTGDIRRISQRCLPIAPAEPGDLGSALSARHDIDVVDVSPVDFGDLYPFALVPAKGYPHRPGANGVHLLDKVFVVEFAHPVKFPKRTRDDRIQRLIWSVILKLDCSP